MIESIGGNMSNVAITPGEFVNCIRSKGDNLREVMLHHWKILKSDVIEKSIFKKLDDDEVYTVYKHGQEIYKLADVILDDET